MFAVRGGRGGGGGKDIDDEDKKWEVMHQTMISINGFKSNNFPICAIL